MRHLATRFLLFSITFFGAASWAQSSAAGQTSSAKSAKKSVTLHLTPVETVVAPSEVAASFVEPLSCDEDGNLFLGSDEPAAAIRKLSPKGERVAVFQPIANPDVKVGTTSYFAVTPDGELYALAFATTEMSRYVLVFKSDGTYKNKIKLAPGFPWTPATLAVFSNGSLLITGQKYDHDRSKPMLPFTGIFASDGSLLKELTLKDDEKITEMAAAHDNRVTSPTNRLTNEAIDWGQAATASDGNIYVMRWLSPAVLYVISPGGQVVRRFEVDSGDANFKPLSMHISGNRIAVLFYQEATFDKVMKIVDLEGREVASYDELREGGKAKLGTIGLAFACYTARPDRFTFLVAGDDHRIELKLVEPR
jgi:hypothetical protein